MQSGLVYEQLGEDHVVRFMLLCMDLILSDECLELEDRKI